MYLWFILIAGHADYTLESIVQGIRKQLVVTDDLLYIVPVLIHYSTT